MTARLIADPARFPKAGDRARAEIGLARWLEAGEGRRFARTFAADPGGRAILEAIFGASPFLSQAMISEMAFVEALAEGGFDTAFANLLAALSGGGIDRAPEAEALRALRVAKRRAALLIGLADIAGAWPLERVTVALSEFAEAALSATCRRLLRQAADMGWLALGDASDPERGCGLIVLGMGKLGALELNYSSDVDLMILFDPARMRTTEPSTLQRDVIKMTHGLVRHMAERTADGYVFRTDLRLRPDPGSTPPALSVGAAETYYESLGQNWERAAMIKARPVAGDREAGAAFIGHLRPFIWRKYLDFAAIQDIHSIKRQINAHHGGGEIAVLGHNLKLGRGGIREIELFAQTQQLIWGGRDPALRVPSTISALAALAASGRITERTAGRLTIAYRYLRRVEHRLQMIADEQTHSLPETAEELEVVARFLGHTDAAAFEAELLNHLRTVEGHYAELFEESPALGGQSGQGNLVFTGTEHDPETLKTIARYGFPDPAAVSSLIRGWHHGRYRAMRSTRARELLTELTPALLEALSKTGNPAAAFVKFDEFLRRLPAGVQIFSLFYANPSLLDIVAQIMGDAPRLADHLSRRPAALEAVLLPGFFDATPEWDVLMGDLIGALGQARDFEDRLAIVRRWTNDRRFQLGVQMLRGSVDAARAGAALADVADAALNALFPAVEDELVRRHGRVPGASLAIVGLGKLGSREMSMTSDLDLIFVYEAPDELAQSDGERPLAAGHYYARLSQRFLSAITAVTEEGALFEVDMRLRPSGQKGPIATSFAAFSKYHSEAAWTWERMALTRARVVAGAPALTLRVERAIHEILTIRRDPAVLLRDAAEMRVRIEHSHPSPDTWDVKHRRGGMVDIEFLVQYLQLLHAPGNPGLLVQNTALALERLRDAGKLDTSDANDLLSAWILWRQIQSLSRLILEDRFSDKATPEGLKALLARAGHVADFSALADVIAATGERVRSIFDRHISRPAAALPPCQGDKP